MNKAELIAKLAEDTGITKTQANAALDSFVEAVTKSLKKGDKVTLVGFGTFSVTKRAARNGRNPQTGEVIKIKVGYNAANEGSFTKPVTITYNGGLQKVINITGTVVPSPATPAPANGNLGKVQQ